MLTLSCPIRLLLLRSRLATARVPVPTTLLQARHLTTTIAPRKRPSLREEFRQQPQSPLRRKRPSQQLQSTRQTLAPQTCRKLSKRFANSILRAWAVATCADACSPSCATTSNN